MFPSNWVAKRTGVWPEEKRLDWEKRDSDEQFVGFFEGNGMQDFSEGCGRR